MRVVCVCVVCLFIYANCPKIEIAVNSNDFPLSNKKKICHIDNLKKNLKDQFIPNIVTPHLISLTENGQRSDYFYAQISK